MKSLLPFIKLFKNQSQWMLFGTLLAWSAILMGIGLMSLSGWFISYTGYLATTSYAVASTFNFFYPAAGVRTFSLGRIVSRYGERVFTHEATFKILSDIRVWFYKKLEPLAPSHLLKYKSGDLLGRLVNDVAALDNLYVRIISPTIVFILACLSISIFFCFFSIKLALTTLILSLITGFGTPFISDLLARKKSQQLNENSSALKTQVVEHISSLAELKIFDLDGYHFNKIKEQNSELINSEIKLSTVSGTGAAIMTFCLGLIIIVTTMIAVSLVESGLLNGAFIALIFLGILALFESIMPLPLAYQYLGKTISAAKRILKITNSKPDIIFDNSNYIQLESYDISFKDVDFGYTNDNLILKDFNLEIEDQQKIALFAPTGSGKSTIVNLLARFWDINKGLLTIGEHSIKDFSESQLRDIMTIINQSPHIFNGSIRENLLLANDKATDEQLWNALEKVYMKDYVLSLKNGLDTWTGEYGKHLSGGQQKRIALARAFLRESPILIMDEPTEGLDKETEVKVFENIKTLMQNKTVIFITHNKKLTSAFDRIFYF
ncbi:heme ABC transporter ATP-binding protein/permease CydC [Francisella frigiditurris]|uniref:Thiol reductant ABC exporter, CydC subunit n=1 Tax=Francisella frigiditurris TaxID=1542390 RepID=A0A1J0KS08_9GAMM|nr:cysteine/glutathione ABC transporter ATP-binding protein/permease CydC [Francisella frigiditurris]APC96557.1 thiol reductant ABC exporter, CydC subunit [Francisella frigiditurris]